MYLTPQYLKKHNNCSNPKATKKNPEPKRYPDFSKLTQLNFYQAQLEELGMNLKFLKLFILTINFAYEILCKIYGLYLVSYQLTDKH